MLQFIFSFLFSDFLYDRSKKLITYLSHNTYHSYQIILCDRQCRISCIIVFHHVAVLSTSRYCKLLLPVMCNIRNDFILSIPNKVIRILHIRMLSVNWYLGGGEGGGGILTYLTCGLFKVVRSRYNLLFHCLF